jgi:hypothetical protein
VELVVLDAATLILVTVPLIMVTVS